MIYQKTQGIPLSSEIPTKSTPDFLREIPDQLRIKLEKTILPDFFDSKQSSLANSIEIPKKKIGKKKSPRRYLIKEIFLLKSVM